MIHLTFPDGARRDYPADITGLEIAKGISTSLAKRTVAMALDGQLADLSDPIEKDAKIEFVTRDDPRALELIRHDAAHVLAEAVQELWPGTQVTIGPVIENGFYYDFFRNEPFTPEDLPTIEAKMREIIARDSARSRKEVWSREEAKQVFARQGRDASRSSWSTRSRHDQQIKIYRQGDWFDLCRGPHMTVDRQDRRRLQADEGRRRLLARRFATTRCSPASTARLGATQDELDALSHAARGSREARPSQARPRARPVPFPGGRPGRRVLARRRAGRCSRPRSPTCAAASTATTRR